MQRKICHQVSLSCLRHSNESPTREPYALLDFELNMNTVEGFNRQSYEGTDVTIAQ
jgi:hypothetical protein